MTKFKGVRHYNIASYTEPPPLTLVVRETLHVTVLKYNDGVEKSVGYTNVATLSHKTLNTMLHHVSYKHTFLPHILPHK